jgi:hypothetical protein
MSRGPTVPAGPVRIHVQSLLDQGMRPVAIYSRAKTSSATLSSLVYGQFTEGRPPQQRIGADVAARLLAVQYEAPAPKTGPDLCSPSETQYELIGYRVGRCTLCGQLAPVFGRSGKLLMYSHPVPAGAPVAVDDDEATAPGALPAAAMHPDCGTPKGRERHRREGTAACDLCKAAMRGYHQGHSAGVAKARREARSAVSEPLAAAVVRACRAIAFREPVARVRQLAVEVVRVADAELDGDEADGAGQEAA